MTWLNYNAVEEGDWNYTSLAFEYIRDGHDSASVPQCMQVDDFSPRSYRDPRGNG